MIPFRRLPIDRLATRVRPKTASQKNSVGPKRSAKLASGAR
jgi:hypothetical protein